MANTQLQSDTIERDIEQRKDEELGHWYIQFPRSSAQFCLCTQVATTLEGINLEKFIDMNERTSYVLYYLCFPHYYMFHEGRNLVYLLYSRIFY